MLNTLSLKEAHKGLEEKRFSSTELTTSCLDRIEQVDGDVHAFLTLTKELALQQAEKVDKKIASGEAIGSLEGIPVALKDNLLMADVRTTAASKILENYKGTYTATAVKKLLDAGAVVLGKTNLDEFAMGSSTENSAYGATKNPWDTSRVPGGSSGGSAAAVSADECMYSLGSDTGGSIRQPASLCGVVGMKPTYGTVSRYGLIAMASSLDQIGPFAKRVEDVAEIFDVIKGKDSHDASSFACPKGSSKHSLKEGIEGLKIGVPKEYFISGMDADVASTVNQAIIQLEKLGAEIVEIELPHTEYALSTYYVIMPAEVSANLSRFDGIRYGTRVDAPTLLDVYKKSRAEGLGGETRRRIMLGAYVLAAGYYDAYYKQAQKVRMLVRRDFEQALSRVDCIVTPTSPIPAFTLGEKSEDPLTMYLADIFTVSANIAGIPGLVVPCGFVQRDMKELPVGLQILGRHFDEATILRVGYAYEQATTWHEKKPKL
ncbi:MAG: Asp-tRNA(Asn)/Glu-tRNA(Gln) amidotransferase subunit GatA [bacterium]|nr:Asp-tRNA(Asn)/Glu-tRNA(Gln) amidotransferase subunit GatA [bacterium]